MENLLKRSCLTVSLIIGLFIVSSSCVYAQGQENYENDSLVGRILHIEGQLLRYVPDDDDWVVTEKDTPFGEYDLLYSSDDGKVEIIMPNNTLLRIGGDTQVQLIELKDLITEIDVSSGSARLYNKSSSVEIKATTPFGDVIMPSETICDLYVYETQAEVVAIKGSVEFMQSGSKARHEVIAGSSSIIATPKQIIASAGSVSSEWDAWNQERDVLWTQRMANRGESGKYLPESLQEDASVLEKNGRWERVYYEGANNYFWRPAYVGVGWTPFSSGRWIVWHGEQTWVPYDSFGYVTHHYGNWIYASNHWYWAPPVSRVMVSAGYPLLNIGVSWYPGRVSWLYSGVSIGWYPLGVYEPYYSHYYWGSRSRVRYYNHYYDHDRHRHKHRRHARFIDHDRFYRSNNYRHAGLHKMRRGEKYRGSSFIPNKIKKHRKYGNRHRLASANDRFRNKISKIDKQRKKRSRQKNWNNLKDNPFKRNFAKAGKRNNKAFKTAFQNKTKKVFKNNKLVKNRNDSARKKFSKGIQKSKEKRNRFVKANTKKRKENLSQTKKTFQKNSKKRADRREKSFSKAKKTFKRTSRKIADNRKKFQKSVRKNTKKVFKSNRKRSDKNFLSNRSDKAFLKNRSEKRFLANHSSKNRSKSRKNNSGSIFKQNRSKQKQNFGKAFAPSKRQNDNRKSIAKQFRNNNARRNTNRNAFKRR